MVSIIIPTYSRLESLTKLIHSICRQTQSPTEIIVVASGYSQNELTTIKSLNPLISIETSSPSVCKQRNLGVEIATSEYILFCDDDIILTDNYLESLLTYITKNPNVNIITGCELQKNGRGEWKEIQSTNSTKSLLYTYVFGLGTCTDLLNQKKTNSYIYNKLINFYKTKGNTISKAGWPLMTQFESPVMKTTIYGLGCAMIKRKTLLENPYNEELGQHGIGDNYEVALKINSLSNKIHVLRNVGYKHFKSSSNRQEDYINYYKRCISLNSFLKKLPYFTIKNQLYFIWSLIGNGFRFLAKKDYKLFRYNQKAINHSLLSLFKS